MNKILSGLGMVGLFIGLILLVAFLYAKHYFMGYEYGWHQKLSVQIQTPAGPVSASSVQAMEALFFPDGLALSGNEVDYDLTGEAVVADLGQGRYLFVLMGPDYLARRSFGDLRVKSDDLGDFFRKIERQAGKVLRDVPHKYWPQMVTFDDIADPATVREVDPDDLAASFGGGYALQGLSVAITDEPVTEGRVEEVLGWLARYRENGWRLNGASCIACPVRSDNLADLLWVGRFKIWSSNN